MSVFPGAEPPVASADPNDTLAAAGHTALHNNDRNEIRAIAQKIGTGASTPTDGKVLTGTGTGTSAWQDLELTAAVLDALWPVGSVYINAENPTNPATLLGVGTWVAWGVGKAIVGIDTGDTDFDTAEMTGGAKTHTLTVDEMPSHTHVQNSHSHSIDQTTAAFNASGNSVMVGQNTNIVAANSNTNATTATNQNTGGGGAHNNLQPYQVGYVWKRTA